MKKNQFNPYDPDAVSFIPVEKPEEGMATIIINTGDTITQYDTEMEDVIVRGEPDLLENSDVLYCRNYRSCMPRPEDLDSPLFKKCAELDIDTGAVKYCDVRPAKDSKDLFFVEDDGFVRKVNNPSVVGNNDYAYGLFIPFCVTVDVLEFCSRAFESSAKARIEGERGRYIKEK